MSSNWKRELFLDRQFEANAFKIDGIGLGSSLEDIDYFDITDIYVNSDGAEQLRFKDRLALLKRGKGWVHLATGASFGIKAGAINQVKLSTRFLQDHKTSRTDFIKIFGKPDIELVDDICYSGFDYNIDANILVYRKMRLYAFLDPKTEQLIELHFGDFDESIYTKN